MPTDEVTTDEEILAVARALAANDAVYAGKPWRTLSPITQRLFCDDAAAAIIALDKHRRGE